MKLIIYLNILMFVLWFVYNEKRAQILGHAAVEFDYNFTKGNIIPHMLPYKYFIYIYIYITLISLLNR